MSIQEKQSINKKLSYKLTYIFYLPRYIAISIIKIYQKILSPDHGLVKIFFPNGHCKFRPTCSEYTISAIEKYGFIKGGIMGAWRILRCNPWNHGGHDPVK